MKGLAKIVTGVLIFAPRLGWSCAVCMGDPNSSVARGANAAIFVMLAILAGVFGLIGSFAYMLYRRSKQPVPPHAELGGIINGQSEAGLN